MICGEGISEKNMTARQKTSVKALRRISKALNVDIEVFASDVDENGNHIGENGSYNPSTRTIRVDISAGIKGDGLVLYTAAHELTHHVKEVAPDKFQAFADAVLEEYSKDGVSVDELINRKLKFLEQNNRLEGLTDEQARELALEEVVADASETMLVDSDAIIELSRRIEAKDKSLWQAIKDFFTNLAASIRAVYKDVAPDSREARLVRQMGDSAERLQKLWTDAVVSAAEAIKSSPKNSENADATGMNAERFSFRDSKTVMANKALSPYNDELSHIIEQNGGFIIDSFDKLTEVANTAFDKPNLKATAYFGIINTDTLEKIKNSIPNMPPEIKDILFKKNKDYSIATTLDAIRHIADEKNLVRNDIVDYLDRLADTIVDFDTVTFDYYYQGSNKTPGLLFKKRFEDGTLMSFLLVSQNKRSLVLQSLYLNAADYQKKKAAKTLLMQNTSAHTSKTQVGQPSIDSISQDSKIVNKKFSTEDDAYIDAVNRGDMETAQMMVDEAASKAGYTELYYHGAKNGGGFTVFRDWSYFTENKQYAERYARNGSLYKTYVKMENPFDTRRAKDRALFADMRQEYGLSEIQDSGLPDWTDGYDISDYIDENELGYDGIILDEGGDLVDGKPVSRGLSYVIRKSEQIKSADPVTHDDNGNIIPLSERFNAENKDIRYSRREGAPEEEWDVGESIEKIAENYEEYAVSLGDIVEAKRRVYGIQITTRNVGKDASGKYNTQTKGVSVNVANDIPTIAHELGHHLANKYGFKESRKDFSSRDSFC